jgi:uncharacterized membrane protein
MSRRRKDEGVSKTLSQHGLSARYVTAVVLFFAVHFALWFAYSLLHLLSTPVFVVLNAINIGVFLWFVWAHAQPVSSEKKLEAES